MSRARDFANLAGSADAGGIGGSNMVINGAMNVAQRNASSTGIGASSGYFTVDRFTIRTSSTAGRLTMSQTAVTDLPGFANCIKLDCTTADTSIAAAEFTFLSTRLEGQDLQQMKKGTSSAEPVTVSFYVKGNAAATYVCEIGDSDNTRTITQAFSVTTSWNRISLTFPGDTTGAFDDDNAHSLQLNFWLHGGSTYSGGTFADNTWAAETNANRYAGSRTSFFDSTDREFFITGVQMEIGEVATPFEHRTFADDLAACKRYFQVHDDMQLRGNPDAGFERIEIYCPLGVSMRANPSRGVITEGNSTNIRSSTTTYSGFVLANRTDGCTLSLESNSAGLASFDDRTESLDAEL
tara:strand:- start:2216 stop:3271 length:1056 start_codon:yes stop_codon:yes gene_type:complete